MDGTPTTGIPVDLDLLERFLGSDSAPDSMGLSDLDGFLTGIAIGPDLMLPAEWLPVIWGERAPSFEDQAEAENVIGAIIGRYHQIQVELDGEPDTFAPIYLEDEDGEVSAAEWAGGFVQAMAMRVDAWEELVRDPDSAIMLMPILALCGDDEGKSLLDLEPEEAEELLADAPDLIPGSVAGIHAFWQQRRRPGASS